MKMLLTDKAQKAECISRILKLLEHFYCYILHFIRASNVVISYFASSSSNRIWSQCKITKKNNFVCICFIVPKAYPHSRTGKTSSTGTGQDEIKQGWRC